MHLGPRFLSNSRIVTRDLRFAELFERTVARIPSGTPPVLSVRRVGLRRRGGLPGLAGLTKWRDAPGRTRSGGLWGEPNGTQTLTFYTVLFGRLSEQARAGVIVHELAHA